MPRKAKDTPSWFFIGCPVCGALAGKNCLELVTAHASGRPGERAIWRREKPHDARVAAGERVRA